MIPGIYEIFAHWHREGAVWIYSDPHFNDQKEIELFGRISDEEQIKNINSKVGKKDTLIILGDVGDVECVKKLKGYKILIAGNHDAGLSNYSDVFDEVYGGALFIGEKLVLSHEPIDIPFALNIHGHVHGGVHRPDMLHVNCCSDVIGFMPINFNQLMKTGPTARIETIHRVTIDKATKRKKERKKKHG